MPAISTEDAAILRQFPQTARRYLSIAPREAVFAARVSGGTIQRDADSSGVIAIPYDSVTAGAYGDVVGGMTLDVGTVAGAADVARVRVRSANASQVVIAETMETGAAIAAGQYLTVRNEFRPWQVRPRRFEDTEDAAYPTSFTEYHDYDLPYSGENQDIPPVANITAGGYSPARLAGFVDAGEDYRTLTLSAGNSLSLCGATITVYLWDVGDGTLVDSLASFPTITVRFPVGFRYVMLTITDSNGASSRMRLPVWVHDAAHPPITAFAVTRDETRADGGREMRFEVFAEPADAGAIPEGSAICYWEDAEFGGDAAPDLYRGQFMGWATRDAVLFRLYRSRYTLDVAGAAGWLERFGGFAQTLVDPGRTPTQWHEMQELTIDRAAHYALRSYSNLLTLVNFYPSTLTDRAQTLDLTRRSLWAQISELVKGYFGMAGCDSLGGIWLRKHLSAYSAAEQAAFVPVIALTNADWTDAAGLVIAQEKAERVGLVEANGAQFDGTTVTPLASKARGQYGVARATMPFQVVSWQGDLNARAGRWLARLNNPYPAATLRLLGNPDAVEPAWCEPISISGAGENLRGLALNDARFLVTRVSAEHSNAPGVSGKVITWTLEAVTSGEDGITLDVPDPVTHDPKPPKTGRGRGRKALLSPGTGTIAALNEDGYVYVTRNFSAVKPTWTRYPITGMSGYLLDFVPDPFSPLYLGTGSEVNGWLVTEQEIGRLADIFGETPSYTVQHTFTHSITAYDGQRVIETERSTQNFVVVASYYPYDDGSYGTTAIVTTDGETWGSEATLTSDAPFAYLSPGLAVSGKAAGVAYSAAPDGAGNFSGYQYSGGSWSPIGSPDISGSGLPGWLHIPWHDNDDSVVFYGATIPEGEADRVYRAVGAARTDITPTADGHSYTCRFPRSIDTCALNRRRVVVCGHNDPSGSTNRNAVFASKDGGDTWGVIYGPVDTTSSDYLSVRCAGDAEDVFYLFGPGGHIAYSADFGATLKDKRGNLTDTAFVGIDRFVNLCGG